MGKMLTWVVVVGLVWMAWRLLVISRRRSQRQSEAGKPEGAAGGAGESTPDEAARLDSPERMMQCAVCGVHMPASEARFAGGKVYCSDAHRSVGQSSPDGGDGAGAPREPRSKGASDDS
jgi:uncharacterized protein